MTDGDSNALITARELLSRSKDDGTSTSHESHGDDVAVEIFTSGTTAEPKIALLRHRHLFSYVVATVEFMSAAEGEASLVSVPPYLSLIHI